ncbi:MAG TPA: homoserine kinase [Gemmatimonadaceae bacterium]|nr:homoserine kinase [Gemmatimonadaceae bacterium]
MTRVTASAPGSIGNLGPGLDVIGCALAGARDEVTAEWTHTSGVSVQNPGHPDLPADPARHTSALAATAVLNAANQRGVQLPARGLALSVRKGLPLSGGQGGSAASAVAGAVATNKLLGDPLDVTTLLACCLSAEEAVSGRHLDNIAASLYGGIVLVRSLDPIEVVRLPVPAGIRIVLAHPSQRLSTADARRVLPAAVSRATAIHQMAQVGAIVAACYEGDLGLLGRAIDDRVSEPARAPLLPGFAAAKRGAMEAGAFAASISGAGPTAFALVGVDPEVAVRVSDAMRAAYEESGVHCTVHVSEIDRDGAIIVETRA